MVTTKLVSPCLQQSREKKTRYDFAGCVCFFKSLQCPCADVFKRPTFVSMQMGASIVALRFTGHRTIEILSLVVPKVSVAGFKLYATSANIVVVPCKRTQHVGPNNAAFDCMGL